MRDTEKGEEKFPVFFPVSSIHFPFHRALQGVGNRFCVDGEDIEIRKRGYIFHTYPFPALCKGREKEDAGMGYFFMRDMETGEGKASLPSLYLCEK